MLTDHLFSVFDQRDGSAGLPAAIRSLIEQQRKSWPLLGRGYEALSSLRLREIQVEGYRVFLQFNPARIVSTGANVDEAAIRSRQCFLCVDNLPSEQRGILYRDEFLILCNPAPIFFGHCTIAHIEHRPQELRPSMGLFLELARDLGPEYTVFYNGPKCGASAPDHLHFQAAPAGAIPIEHEAIRPDRRQILSSVGGTTLVLLQGLGREVVLIEGDDLSMIVELMNNFLESLETLSGRTEEPMVNVIAGFTDGAWRSIIFPRRKHRPDVFFMEGEGKILVSPAAVDMGGLIVTPLEKDFARIGPDLVDAIYHEVSLGRETIVESLRDLL